MYTHDWMLIFRHIIGVFYVIITTDGVMGRHTGGTGGGGYGGGSGGSECPRSSWDEPSKRCSDSLDAVLGEIRNSDRLISAESRVNKTCREWDRTNACYQSLIQRCMNNDLAMRELRLHIGRYVIYSLPCNDQTPASGGSMHDCFLEDLQSTRMCTKAIDKYLHKYLASNDYRSACRIVTTSMKCFHDVKDGVAKRCTKEGADEYHRSYIQPLVERTRDIVLSQCGQLESPYHDYFVRNSAASFSSTRSGIALELFLFYFNPDTRRGSRDMAALPTDLGNYFRLVHIRLPYATLHAMYAFTFAVVLTLWLTAVDTRHFVERRYATVV